MPLSKRTSRISWLESDEINGGVREVNGDGDMIGFKPRGSSQ
jgi:hypothetical protein